MHWGWRLINNSRVSALGTFEAAALSSTIKELHKEQALHNSWDNLTFYCGRILSVEIVLVSKLLGGQIMFLMYG